MGKHSSDSQARGRRSRRSSVHEATEKWLEQDQVYHLTSPPSYYPDSHPETNLQGSQSSYKRSSSKHSQPSNPTPSSSSRYPPMSNNKYFSRQNAGQSETSPPRRPRSSSHGQKSTVDGLQAMLRGVSIQDRRDSQSSSKQPTRERSRRESGASLRSRRDSLDYQKDGRAPRQSFDGISENEREEAFKRWRRQSYHENSAYPPSPAGPAPKYREDYGYPSQNPDWRASYDGGREKRQSHKQSELESEMRRLKRVGAELLFQVEEAWAEKSWARAMRLYGRIQSNLERLSSLEYQLGGPGYEEYQRQADDAIKYRRIARENLLSCLEREYLFHMDAAEAFMSGRDQNMLNAAASYANAIAVLEEIGCLSPARLNERFPGRIQDLHRWRQQALEKGYNEDCNVVQAVRGFVSEFYLVETLIVQGNGAQARIKFDQAKNMLANTLLALPMKYIPSKYWRDNMALGIKDQEKRAKERFGENW